MKTVTLKELIEPQVRLAFELAGELVRDCVFHKTESDAKTGLVPMAARFATVKALFVDYRSQDIEGSGAQLGDEKCFVRADELASITSPSGGDVLTETATGIGREVVATKLDPSGSMWVLQVRRAGAEDWGDLSASSQSMDLGDLAAGVVFDDWQA